MPVQHTQQAYLHGHGLPRRWARRGQFVVLETAFGLGHHFLAVWEAWRQDPARCERLFYVAVEPRPVSIEVLMHAHELGTQGGTQVSAQVNAQVGNAQALWQAWPPLTPNFHCLKFEEGRVQLLLAFGEVAALLPKLRLQADAFCIEGLGSAAAPGPHDARIAKGLGALAAPGATLVGIDIDSARRQHLITAGFVLRPSAGAQAHPDVTLADWAPRHIPRRPPDVSLPGRQAVVVGAGLAGAAAAQALVQAGWQVTVLERHAGPAASIARPWPREWRAKREACCAWTRALAACKPCKPWHSAARCLRTMCRRFPPQTPRPQQALSCRRRRGSTRAAVGLHRRPGFAMH